MSAERTRRAIGLVLFVCFGIGVAIYLLGRVGTTLLPTTKQYMLEADVKSSIALASAADIREAGVRIGRVTGIKAAGSITALELSIDAKYGPVYRDGTVLIRAKSVAGENYVQLDPGDPRSGAIPTGGVLPVNRELQAVQDDDVFSIFDTPERRNLQRALRGLGQGLAGQGGNHLNQTLEAMTSVINQGQNFSRVLADERTQTAQLIASFDTVASALGNRAADIQTLTRAALTTASAVATRDRQLQSTLATLPGFLRQSQITAGRLGSFSVNATPVMYNLRIAAQDLVPAIQALGPASREASTTLATLQRFAAVAQPTFRKLNPFTQATRAFVSPYSGFLQQLNPLVAFMNPYWQELSTWFANTGAAVQASDPVSHLARVTLPISRSNFPTIIQGPAAQILANLSGGLDTRGTNAYPLAGSSDTPEIRSSIVPPLQADPPYTVRSRHDARRAAR
jgi:phospholipid/cholesterol/gamma-HCH transport system substrate-binding protein